MGKKTTAFFLILFLSAAAFADVFDRQFNVDYQSLPAPAYASTNISIAPSITPSTIVKCTGSTYSPSLSLSTAYVVPAYEGHLANDVLVGSYSSCLVPYTTLSPNQPINWVTNSQYASLAATNWYSSSAAFQSVVPGMLQSDERSQYMNPLTGQPFVVGGDNRFDARIGLFCTASVELVSSTNPSFNQMVASQYTGQALTVPSLTLPSSPSTVQIAQRVNVTHCIASGRTVLNPSCSSYETVWMYHSSAFPVSTTSAPISISVQNPFACNLAATVFSPMAMNNSTTYSFSLTVKNNGDSVNVNSISIVQPSGFSALSITSPALPTTIAAGATQVFSGSVKAPAAIGMQTLTVQISSVSSLPNCTGSTANCNLVASFAINITNSSTSGTPASCSLALDGHGANFIPQDGTDVIATCLSGSGATVPCGTLGWSTTATGGTMSPTSTVSPPQASLSNFNINAVSAPQSSAIVKAQGAGFSCTTPISITGPDYTPVISAPASVQVGTPFTATVATKNIAGAANRSTVTIIRFRSLSQNFNVGALASQDEQDDSFNSTCPLLAGLYEINATVDSTGQLTEGNEGNNFATQMINCTTAPGYTISTPLQ